MSILPETLHGRPGFLERWHSPALLVEGARGRRPLELDGRSPYRGVRRTPTRAAVTGALVAEAPVHPHLEEANLAWIEKSPRNSFTHIISLGRAAENDLRFDLESLSLIHATFARSGERWYVQDHGSTNGTFINGERLGPGAVRRLSDGDTLRFGDALKTRFFGPQALFDFLCIVHRVAPSNETNG